MRICPNLSDPITKKKWDALVNNPEIGTKEAMREFMEAEIDQRPVGSPERVIAKLKARFPDVDVNEEQSRIAREREVLVNKTNDPTIDDPDSLLGRAILSTPINTKTLTVDDNSRTRGLEMAHKLSQQLGIPYQIVTAEQAMIITNKAKNPIDVAINPAFFYQGTVYFISERINTQLAFHEFAHPIVKALQLESLSQKSTDPKAQTLFDKLSKEAVEADPTLRDEAIREYANLAKTIEEETDPETKAELYNKYENLVNEEIIVKALTRAAMNKQAGVKTQGPLAKVVDKILYAIKQLLRRAFGTNVKVSKLDANTTLDQLAEMLVAGGKFEIDTELVNQDDLVAYNNEYETLVKELADIASAGNNEVLIDLTRRMYDGTNRHIEMLIKNKNYSALLDLFVDEFNRGDLQEMRSNIAKYSKKIVDRAQEVMAEMEDVQNQSQALVTSMLRLKVMMEKMKDHVNELRKDSKDRDSAQKAYYYAHVLEYWQKYIDQAKNVVKKTGNKSNTPIIQLLDSIKNTMDTSSEKLREMTQVGVADVLWQQWEPLSMAAEDAFKQQVETMRKKGATPQVIENLFIKFYGMPEAEAKRLGLLQDKLDINEPLNYNEQLEYERLNKAANNGIHMTKQRIEAALRGEGPDAKYMSSYFEGYLYNADPVIGGFAMYFRDNITEMENRAQSRYNEIIEELKPALDRAGINLNKAAQLGRDIGFTDTVGEFDKKTGTYVEKEIWTLLNPWKNYRFDKDKFNHEIRQLEMAYNKSGSQADKDALIQKLAEKKKHMRKWFFQKYTDNFYEADELLEKDTVGKTAAYERDAIYEKMKVIKATKGDETDMERINKELDLEYRKLRTLYSRYYLNGKLKRNYYIDENNVQHEIKNLDDVDALKNKGYTVVLDLAIADRLSDHRKMTNKFYEFKERPGVFQNEFIKWQMQTRLNLVSLGYKPDSADPAEREEYEDYFNYLKSEWLKRNTRTSIKKEYYQSRAQKISRIKELTNMPITRLQDLINKETDPVKKAAYEKSLKDLQTKMKKVDFSTTWTKILDVISGFKDEDGQPIGNDVPEGRKKLIKEAQQEMEDSKSEWAGMSGLTRDEMSTLIEYSVKRARGEYIDPKDWSEYMALLEKQKMTGLTKEEKNEINGLFAELSAMQKKDPTQYYVDAVNHQLSMITDKEALDALGTNELDQTSVAKLEDPKVLEKLFKASPQFKAWFTENHISRERYNQEEKKMVTYYERLYVWNTIKPADPSMYETTTIKNEDGTEQVIQGVPSMKYYSRVVKKEYYTGYDKSTGQVKLVVGKHIDNMGRGDDSFLPKDVAGSPYRNDRYYELRDAAPGTQESKLFDILEIIKKNHIKNQEGLTKRGRLYYDFPRYEMDTFEALQTRGIKGAKEKVTGLKALLMKIINFFRGSKADPDFNFTWEQENQLVRADAFDDQIENIPIQGLYNLKLAETSTDILTGLGRYLYAAEHHKQLVKMNPIAQGIKRVLNDPNQQLKEPDKINLQNHTNLGLTTYANKKGKYIRKDAFNNMYQRDFMGEQVTGFGKDWKGFQNVQRLLFGRASFSFFAFNIPSALKNMFGAKFQSLIHSAAGTDITPSTLLQGEAWSLKYMTKLSMGDAYAKGLQSLEHQIGSAFDPIDKFEAKFGRSISRTLLKDAVGTGWFTNFRKWTEMQAGMQTFGGMMYKKKVKMGDEDIDYMNAWELVDGKLALKKGIDVRYSNQPTTYTVQEGDTLASVAKKMFMSEEDLQRSLGKQSITAGSDITIDNTEFKAFRGRVQAVMRKLNGAYAKYDQPEAQRWLAFRFVSYLRRYFTTMAINRFGTQRWNPGYGEIDEGYYITAVKALGKLMRHKNINDMTATDKKAFMRLITEVGTIYIMGMLLGLLWDWDDDDEERFEKLRERSGFLPTFLTREKDYGEDFNMGGFLSLHALNLMMQVRAENEQFIPLPKYGLRSAASLLDLKSIAFGPTTDTMQEIIGDIGNWWEDSDRAYYKRRVGPYAWQDEGGYKLWAHIGKSFGLTGSNIAPDQVITNFQKAQSLNYAK